MRLPFATTASGAPLGKVHLYLPRCFLSAVAFGRSVAFGCSVAFGRNVAFGRVIAFGRSVASGRVVAMGCGVAFRRGVSFGRVGGICLGGMWLWGVVLGLAAVAVTEVQ